MSSTKRGANRNKFDYYVTPTEQIETFLNSWSSDVPFNPDWRWLDPSAGGDQNNEMSYPTALSKHSIYPVTLDVREDSLAQIKGDYLSAKSKSFDVIITNPPFDLAMDFIQKALDDVKEGGYVVMLLRLNFYGSKKRYQFFKENMPEYCYIHHKRMSFTPDGKTDSIEYAHFVWRKGHSPKFTKTRVI